MLKSNFHFKKTGSKDGLDARCISCLKKYYLDDRDKVKQNYINIQDRLNNCQKNYNFENKEKIILYIKNRITTDVNFQVIHNTRRTIHHALNGKLKSSSTRDILGIEIETYRKWIERQMAPEMNWDNIEIDHVKAICMFDVSKDEGLREAFTWKNTQPLLKHDHQK